jgi:uncharacterized coiled-coil protein SlyX
MTHESQPQLDRVQERLQVIRSSIRRDDPPEVGWGRQEEIIGLLADVTHSFADAVEVRRDEHVEVVQRIATIESTLVHLGRDIGSLCKVVRDGNGQPSLVHRLSSVENTLNHQARQIEEISEYANSINASKMLTRTQLVVGLSGMLLTAVISFAALIATLLKS